MSAYGEPMRRLLAPLTMVLATCDSRPRLGKGGCRGGSENDVFGDFPASHAQNFAAPGPRTWSRSTGSGPGEPGIRDTGATMTARDGCVLVNAHAVRYTAITTTTGQRRGGDRRPGRTTVTIDPELTAVALVAAPATTCSAARAAWPARRATTRSPPTRLLERRGNDLLGGSGRDVLRGGSAPDRLDGGIGRRPSRRRRRARHRRVPRAHGRGRRGSRRPPWWSARRARCAGPRRIGRRRQRRGRAAR